MRRYPLIPAVILGVLSVGLVFFIFWVTAEQVRVNQKPTGNSEIARPAFPIPLAAAIVQTGGLLLTVLLACFPIQAASFNQSKKYVLDEILCLTAKYQCAITEIYDAFYKQQTGVDFTVTFTVSRATITRQKKNARSLMDRVCLFLNKNEAEEFKRKSHTWWQKLMGDEAFAMSKKQQWKEEDQRCDVIAAAHTEFIQEIDAVRKRCMCDEIKYWKYPQK